MHLAIDNNWITSSFNFSAPSGAVYDFMFDLWTDNNQDELMVIQQATTSGTWGSQIASNVTIAGRNYSSVWQANNGSNNVIIFVPSSGRTSGTEDLMAYFKWSKDRGLLHNSNVLGINLGVEVTSTNGWQQFTMNSFSASWGANSGSSSGNVTIQNKATGLYIDGMGRSSNGSNAGQYSGGSSNNQKWTMETSGNNVKFKNVATGIYLDGMGRTSNGSLVGQYSGGSSSNQQWVVETSGNYKKIKNAATGLYIDGMYWNSNGSDLGQWSNSGSDAQLWTITTVKSAEENSGELSNVNEGKSDVLYPNPFTSEITLSINNPEQVTNIVVTDISGRQVEVINRAAVKNLQTIGSSLKAGTYVVQVNHSGKTQSFTVIKK
jgi:hypothetical protein